MLLLLVFGWRFVRVRPESSDGLALVYGWVIGEVRLAKVLLLGLARSHGGESLAVREGLTEACGSDARAPLMNDRHSNRSLNAWRDQWFYEAVRQDIPRLKSGR